MAKITAKDCSPFYVGKDKEKRIDVDNPNNKILQKFILSVSPINIYGDNSRQYDEDSKLAYSPWESHPLDDGTRAWFAGRYIGTSFIDNNEIIIEPRFGITWLSYLADEVFHFRFINDNSKNNTKGKLNELYKQLFWSIWIRKFAEADIYGLPRQTAKHTQTGMQIRGRLNAYKSIIPLFTKQKVVSEYREKELDDGICRIVYKAYDLLARNSRINMQPPQQIQESINTLYFRYHGEVINVTAHDYQSISYKNIYQSWKPLVDFSWQIINNLLQSTKAGGKGFSIFLDVAEIWEAFLRKKLGEAFSSDGWRVLSVEECHYGIYQDSFFKREIIPDIILQKGDEYMVFDAKYKRMLGRKEDVDRTDLFQIHTYIQYIEHCMGDVVLAGLLYPITDKEFKDSDKNLYHSTNLFGAEKGKEKEIRFIIDGIYCKEMDNDIIDKSSIESQQEIIENNVAAMIKRIKKILEK